MDLKAELKKLTAAYSQTPAKADHCEPCCPELAAELLRNRDALIEALCANCCACHAANCCYED